MPDYTDNVLKELIISKITQEKFNDFQTSGLLNENEIYLIEDETLNAMGHRVLSVADPTELSDAANKKYVDQSVSEIRSSLSSIMSSDIPPLTVDFSGYDLNSVSAEVLHAFKTGQPIYAVNLDIEIGEETNTFDGLIFNQSRKSSENDFMYVSFMDDWMLGTGRKVLVFLNIYLDEDLYFQTKSFELQDNYNVKDILDEYVGWYDATAGNFPVYDPDTGLSCSEYGPKSFALSSSTILNTRGYSDWDIIVTVSEEAKSQLSDESGASDNDYAITLSGYNGYVGSYLAFAVNFSGDRLSALFGQGDARLNFSTNELIAVRSVVPGYVLGSQTDKPLASEAEISALESLIDQKVTLRIWS